MSSKGKSIVLVGLFLWSHSIGLVFPQNQVSLEILQFPERDTTKIEMFPTFRVSPVEMEARVRFAEGQTRIEVSYKGLKPAVLFAGDITCYVLWAITRDGNAENLGELWARPEKDEDTIAFSTGQRSFALLVTAEAYYQVTQPSPLVIFQSGQRERNPVRSTPLTYSSFASPPRFGLDRLANVRYDGKTPLDLLQAQKVFEIAEALGAEKQASSIFQEARIGLQQATIASARNARKGAQEYARRSVAASNDAIRITLRVQEAIALEERIAKRQAEIETLEARAGAAETRAREFGQAVEDLRAQQTASEKALENSQRALENSQRALENSQQELDRIGMERQQLEATVDSLQQQQDSLRASLRAIEQEKGLLENRLEGALSQIAETRQSAEGFIVNLPDILFDVNQATLKREAEVVLAKMAGVLLIMQNLDLQIDGHTDSTGSASHNLELSQRRANSVLDFMATSGITTSRMKAFGYGFERPIAENTTAEGRRKNRRVEILVKESGQN